MRALIRCVLGKATERVSHPRHQKEQYERQSERMLIQAQDPAPSPHGPRRLGVTGEVARIRIDQFLHTGRRDSGDPF